MCCCGSFYRSDIVTTLNRALIVRVRDPNMSVALHSYQQWLRHCIPGATVMAAVPEPHDSAHRLLPRSAITGAARSITDNSQGTGGVVATVFGDLVNNPWLDKKADVVKPPDFKRKLGKVIEGLRAGGDFQSPVASRQIQLLLLHEAHRPRTHNLSACSHSSRATSRRTFRSELLAFVPA